MTNALPARKDSRVRETVLSPVAPQGFQGQTNLINFGFNGFPDPYHSSPGLELLKSATFFIDAANAKDGDAYAFNQGTGGFALDARYGSSLAIGAADTNDPLLLPWSGETYVYLPGSASNTIACTAPVGTASYAAYPTGGGAATTGAAVAGAFTLQTTGSWVRVDILDAGPTVIASFVAANSTSTGYTDAFSVVWTINRSTAGRKSVAVTRPVWLLGTDDYMEVANNALLNMDASQSFTVLAVARGWGTYAGTLPTFLGKASSTGLGTAGQVGWQLRANVTTDTARFDMGDGGGANRVTATATSDLNTGGALHVISAVADRTSLTLQMYIDATSSGSPSSLSSMGSTTNTQPVRVGSPTDVVLAGSDFELLALAIFRRALTAAEIASINTYYGTA